MDKAFEEYWDSLTPDLEWDYMKLAEEAWQAAYNQGLKDGYANAAEIAENADGYWSGDDYIYTEDIAQAIREKID